MEDWKRADFFRHNYENVHSSETKLYTVYEINMKTPSSQRLLYGTPLSQYVVR